MPQINPKLKKRFLKVYSNLPMGVRKEIIAVVEDQPITWNVAYIEVENETEFGEKIIKKLTEMDMI